MCLRNVSGGPVNPMLPLTEITLESIQKWLPPDSLAKLELIYMCGNHGDPAVGKETLEIFQYFRKVNPKITLQMFTNGSIRTRRWWEDLAKVVDTVRFSIDGLKDTNSIYRRGTNFDRIIVNMEAYISAGGTAEWDFIVFKHNEHQVEEAQALANKMGCTKFTAKKTNRFPARTRSPDGLKHPILDKNLKVVGNLEAPAKKEFLNRATSFESSSTITEKSSNTCPIQCKVSGEKSIYISAQGHVFPCCWTAGALYPWYAEPRTSYMWDLINQTEHGIEGLSLDKHTLQEVVDGDFFQSVLPKSWTPDLSKSAPPLCCSNICGQKIDGYKEQF